MEAAAGSVCPQASPAAEATTASGSPQMPSPSLGHGSFQTGSEGSIIRTSIQNDTAAASSVSEVVKPLMKATPKSAAAGIAAQRRSDAKPAASTTIANKLNIELCAGSAGYSARISKLGLSTLPIDNVHNRQRQKFPCITLDLGSPEGQEIVLRTLRQGRVFSIGVAPPCGTATRAREKSIPAKKRQGARAPPQLRSDEFPLGLPDALAENLPFTALDADRLLQANAVYDFVSSLLSEAHSLGVHWWAENPSRSYMRQTPGFVALASLQGAVFHELQPCMFGGARPKWTCFLTNIPNFGSIALKCDGNHPHAPWLVHNAGKGLVFDTATEAEYPDDLCRALANLILELAVLAGFDPAASALSKDHKDKRDSLGASAARQPRGTRFPKLLQEYKEISSQSITLASRDQLEPLVGKVLPQTWMILLGLAGQSGKLLELREKNGAEAAQTHEAKIGINKSETGFLERACQLCHPCDARSQSDNILLHAIFDLLTAGPEATVAS